ncbi:serine/threonine-protein phosphatase [Acidobacteria bacterium AB60]|nr:serine/threonine-protein phosphatase [Acidobacteria bacterium AB60]
MKIPGRAVSQFDLRWILRILVSLCASLLILGAAAQSSQPAPQNASSPGASSSPATPSASSLHAVIQLDGPWRFNIGDDPRWADPAFDDSTWREVSTTQSLFDQGIETYAGFAWYRMRIQPQELAQFGLVKDDPLLALLITGNGVGQLSVYVNGMEAARTRGMSDRPTAYQSLPFIVPLAGADTSSPIVLAVRAWVGSSTQRGVLLKAELGNQHEVAERFTAANATQWNINVAAASAVGFAFFAVAVLGLALYLAQRHHSEYLWLALLCTIASSVRVLRMAFGLGYLSIDAYGIIAQFGAYFFIVATLEFVYRFTGSHYRRLVRGFQIVALLVPFLYFLHAPAFQQVIGVAFETAFSILVVVMLAQAWRGGRGDAGAMLFPFILVGTGDWISSLLETAANFHWLPQSFAAQSFNFGPVRVTPGEITDGLFLASLIAVILYRFIRVSQVEQQSNAEISAARSVQALLIPTQLPSTRHFMLESAYLPIHGVGGDFFQVLPLKDDSLLIVVGDVSGKGLQAAMNSSTLVGALRNELSHDPGTVLEHLNRVLLGAVASPGAVPELDAAPCFATCLCARVYPDGKLVIANAGHLGPYRDGRELELIPGLPLGVIAESQYEETTYQLNQGDRLVFLSDGVVEAQNAEGELFGFDRTQQVSNEPARYIAQIAQRFGQTDDITVVSLYVATRTARRDAGELSHRK